jgi:hypothetical protein
VAGCAYNVIMHDMCLLLPDDLSTDQVLVTHMVLIPVLLVQFADKSTGVVDRVGRDDPRRCETTTGARLLVLFGLKSRVLTRAIASNRLSLHPFLVKALLQRQMLPVLSGNQVPSRAIP